MAQRNLRWLAKKSGGAAYLLGQWLRPAFEDPLPILGAVPRYLGFLRGLIRYSRMDGAEPISVKNVAPYLHDRTGTHPLDKQYFYQQFWAFQRVVESKVPHHVDVGSRLDFVSFLTAFTKVTFIDIRPLDVLLENLESREGTILSLPYAENAVVSLSSLHVAEHIGLGRYGDPLDPLGTKKAAKELARVLAPKGNLYFSLPVGKPRLCFNAHRVHSPQQILEYFRDLELVEFSCIDDPGHYKRHADPASLEDAEYSCGLFWFRKT